ncbi:MAG: pyrroline-5-carboxylate reductase [Deltaproteobacteria bacterium]|nr:pyrroline-5-carboxylate reductase [Deltaproteobacteria bacterium]
MGTESSFGVIGGGNMGEALVKGLILSGQRGPAQIIVSEPLESRREFLREEYQIVVTEDNQVLMKEAENIILAVKPQIMDRVLDDIKAAVTPDHLIISIAAGVNLATIQGALPDGVPVIRTMPNTPALVLAGAAAMAPGKYAGPEHMETARGLFEAVGLVVEVEEKHLDAVTGLSGSGPAYVFIFLEALADAGVLMGLARPDALALAAQTILGSAQLAMETGRHTGQLKDMVTSPGGTTIAGLSVLELGGLRGLIMEAVKTATNRSIELGAK